jgi:hypothetical protein
MGNAVIWLILLLVVLLASVTDLTADDNVIANGDFETGDFSGWITSGDVTVVQDALDPLTDNAMHAVAQGGYSAMVGDQIPWAVKGPQRSTISQKVTVQKLAAGQKRVVLQFSYAVVANDPPSHPEPDKPYFTVTVLDLNTGESLYDTSYVYTSQTSKEWYLGKRPDQSLPTRGFSTLSGDRWVFVPWRNIEVDLTPRVGHQISLLFEVRDCNPTAHAAYGYLDNIRVGTPMSIKLPDLTHEPPRADWVDPNIINNVLLFIETWKIWPWCLLLPILLLLLWLLLLFLRRRPEQEPVAERMVPTLPEGQIRRREIRKVAEKPSGRDITIETDGGRFPKRDDGADSKLTRS